MAFQSHYGLILSARGVYEKKVPGRLSIPLWSDFITTVSNTEQVTWASFQSHYGLILSLPPFGSGLKLKVLSIPLWSDFIELNKELSLVYYKAFNPTMVWFYQYGSV